MSITLPDGITAIALADDYPALQIETADCSATLALNGAHLTHWQPSHTDRPVIYLSPTAILQQGKAIRGGVPLCWPWFNAHPTDPGSHPSHGVARIERWDLVSATVEDGSAIIELELKASPGIEAHVPFPFQLKALFNLGQTCSIVLETTNLAKENIAVGGALHSYFSLSHIDNATVTGLQHTPYLDTAARPEKSAVQTEGELRFQAETDRIYYGSDLPARIHDAEWKRSIVVEKAGSLTSVVWNPWIEKAASLGDLPDADYQRFLCIEAANARHDTRILAPGSTHRLETRFIVENLS
ncbi:D-hexose-6-phosphate mutarotase [Roseibacillus persicicus]|uniref:D-hexose-6-phosphate mutarotase n=1 Tax=Roseibacillus persicicus TaxID=454148 RepID=UPI00398BA316